jgi:virginiamycin B lyase
LAQVAAGFLCLAAAAGPQPASAVSLSEFAPLPRESSLPAGVVGGPDGAVWFTELNSYPFTGQVGRIGRLEPGGALTEYSLPGSNDQPTGIAPGPDGNLWFTNFGSDTIGRITPAGAISEYGGIVAGGAPEDVTTGPDGALWFTEGGYNAGNRVGRIDPGSGSVRQYCIRGCGGAPGYQGDGLQPGGIVSGPDGRLWFTEANPADNASPYGDAGVGYVAATSTDGAVHEYPVPTRDAQPTDIAVGSDGALWFTERIANRIGRITTGGELTEFPVPTPSSRPEAVATGPDGAVWFLENAANQIGRVAADGSIAEFPIPKANSNPGGIGAGPDSRMYFTETSGNRLGAVTTDFAAPGGPGGGAGPGATGGSTAPAAIARVSVRTRWRRLRGRWWLSVRGALAPARGVARARACAGRRVEVRLRRGRTSVGLRRVRATRRCQYLARLPYGRAASRRRGRLSVVVRLPGVSRPAPVVRAVPPPRRLTPVR